MTARTADRLLGSGILAAVAALAFTWVVIITAMM
jgi:hypothetical protein